jgi:hypothetical protein
MLDFVLGGYGGHSYSFVATGLKTNERVFASRQAANDHMYELCDKLGLHICDVYDDKHDKTYICDNGVRFYIQRM